MKLKIIEKIFRLDHARWRTLNWCYSDYPKLVTWTRSLLQIVLPVVLKCITLIVFAFNTVQYLHFTILSSNGNMMATPNQQTQQLNNKPKTQLSRQVFKYTINPIIVTNWKKCTHFLDSFGFFCFSGQTFDGVTTITHTKKKHFSFFFIPSLLLSTEILCW